MFALLFRPGEGRMKVYDIVIFAILDGNIRFIQTFSFELSSSKP